MWAGGDEVQSEADESQQQNSEPTAPTPRDRSHRPRPGGAPAMRPLLPQPCAAEPASAQDRAAACCAGRRDAGRDAP